MAGPVHAHMGSLRFIKEEIIMDEQEYHLKVNEIIDKVQKALDIDDFKGINDIQRLVIPSYLFGMINAFSMQNGATHMQVQAAVVAMLVKRFGYDPKSAVEYFFFLVDATKKENHPAVNNIICRGLDRFESIDDNEVVKNEVDRIVSILSEK